MFEQEYEQNVKLYIPTLICKTRYCRIPKKFLERNKIEINQFHVVNYKYNKNNKTITITLFQIGQNREI